jgi:hypothetical protein
MKRKLFGGAVLQPLIIDYGRLADASQPVLKSIVLPRFGQVIKREVKSPRKNPLVGFLFDIFIQHLLIKIPFFRFNFIIVQKILVLRYIFGGPAGNKQGGN